MNEALMRLWMTLPWLILATLNNGCQIRSGRQLPTLNKSPENSGSDQQQNTNLLFTFQINDETDSFGGTGGGLFGSTKDEDNLFNHINNQIDQGESPGVNKLRILKESIMVGGVLDYRIAQIYQNDSFEAYPADYTSEKTGFVAGTDEEGLPDRREQEGEILDLQSELFIRAEICQININVTNGNSGVYISGIKLYTDSQTTYGYGNQDCKAFKHFATDEFEVLDEEGDKQVVRYSQRPENNPVKQQVDVTYEKFIYDARNDGFIAGIKGRAGHVIDALSFVTVSWQEVLPETTNCPIDSSENNIIAESDFVPSEDCMFFTSQQRNKPLYIDNATSYNNAYCQQGNLVNIPSCYKQND